MKEFLINRMIASKHWRDIMSRGTSFCFPAESWTTLKRPRIYINFAHSNLYTKFRLYNTYKQHSPSSHWQIAIHVKHLCFISLEFKRKVG